MIVGISGKAGHGKNTLGMFIAMNLRGRGITSKTVALADHLKLDAQQYMGWNGEKDAVGRFALQKYGELMRQGNPNYWIKRLETPAMMASNDVYIITDIRYKNEAEWLRKNGGFIVRVEATKDGEPIPSDDHISETDLDDWKDWDWMVTAEYGDLDTLWKYAVRIAEMVVYKL